MVLALVQRTSGWPEWRSLPDRSGAGRGVRSRSGRLSLRRLRRGAIVADVARRAAVYAGQIYRWRQELGHASSGFSQVVIAAMADGGSDRAAQNPAPAIEIEFTGAARLRIPALTPPELAAAVVRALR
jgi:transposase-like protein